MAKKVETPVAGWTIKDRNYYLLNGLSPLTYTIASKHSAIRPLLWFDEETGAQRELRYATNMSSPFKDEQVGEATLGHIMFVNGHLYVPKEQQALQKLLSLYHPQRNKLYKELDPVAVAVDDLEDIENEVKAMNLALSMDVEMAEAILRVSLGSRVSMMSSKEIKRDLLIFAKKKPLEFIELANDDNVQLRNIAVKAVERGIIKLSQDQRYFTWGDSNRKLVTVPFDENPYSAFAAYLKTDEGVEVFSAIEKKLK